jgi:integrase/recombinase XerD
MSLLPYSTHDIKPVSEFPKHITYEQYLDLLEKTAEHYNSKKYTETREFRRDRDILFLKLLWESGGRVTDVLNIKVADIDFKYKELTLWIEKRDKYHTISLFEPLLTEIRFFIEKYKIKKFIFGRTRQWGWWKVRQLGKLIGIKLNPHQFRHGLALYLLQKGVDIRVIAFRLDHASPLTTIKSYLIVTPEIERIILTSKDVFP